jgi:hypothetical protein
MVKKLSFPIGLFPKKIFYSLNKPMGFFPSKNGMTVTFIVTVKLSF